MNRLRDAWAVTVVLAAAADDLVTSWFGTRPIRWHARRLARMAREIYRLAVYGEPSDSVEVELKIYDPELLEETR